MKNKNIATILIFSLLLIFIGGYFTFIVLSTDEQTYVDANLGNIHISVTPIYNLFTVSQNVFFPKETAELGDNIELRDDISYTVGQPDYVYHSVIKSDTQIDISSLNNIRTVLQLQVAQVDVTSLIRPRDGASDIIVTTFTPKEIGYYTVVSWFQMPDFSTVVFIPYNQVQVVEVVIEPVEEEDQPFIGDVPEPEGEIPTDTGPEIQEPITPSKILQYIYDNIISLVGILIILILIILIIVAISKRIKNR